MVNSVVRAISCAKSRWSILLRPKQFHFDRSEWSLFGHIFATLPNDKINFWPASGVFAATMAFGCSSCCIACKAGDRIPYTLLINPSTKRLDTWSLIFFKNDEVNFALPLKQFTNINNLLRNLVFWKKKFTLIDWMIYRRTYQLGSIHTNFLWIILLHISFITWSTYRPPRVVAIPFTKDTCLNPSLETAIPISKCLFTFSYTNSFVKHDMYSWKLLTGIFTPLTKTDKCVYAAI